MIKAADLLAKARDPHTVVVAELPDGRQFKVTLIRARGDLGADSRTGAIAGQRDRRPRRRCGRGGAPL